MKSAREDAMPGGADASGGVQSPRPGSESSQEEAVRQLENAADRGDADAQFRLGGLREAGQDVPQDCRKAREWYEKAAEQGHAEAQYRLGLLHLNGHGVPGAAHGSVRCPSPRGCAFAAPDRDGRQDFAKAAREWFEKAALQGHAGAQFNLGLLCERGEGGPQDFAQAAKWYEQAAAGGLAEAQLRIAVFCERGLGIPRNFVKARLWYEKAVMQGRSGAQNNEGVLYLTAYSVHRNLMKARKLLQQSAAGGSDEERNNLETLEKDSHA